MTLDSVIDGVIEREGGYVDNPSDKGGKTRYGITEAVARSNGYSGDMKYLPLQFARDIYKRIYITRPKFDKIFLISEKVGVKLVDAGVNMGTVTAAKFLQKSLNALNMRGSLYPDLIEDGECGEKTQAALKKYLSARALQGGEQVLLKAISALQCARYIDISQSGKNEDFVFGWIKNRIEL